MGSHGWWHEMSQLAIVDSDAFDHIKKVADLYVKGSTSPYTIARRLNMKVVEVRAAIEQWHEIINQDAESKDLAREYLNTMVYRYDTLIEEANDNMDNLKAMVFDEKISAQVNTTIKTIAELDKVRVDLLQKAGLLEAGDLGDELAEREANEAMLIEILRNDLCHVCSDKVRDKISRMTGTVEGEVISDVVDVD